MNPDDSILIRGLRVSTNIGVPDEERASAQEIILNVEMNPKASHQRVDDDIARTVDYHAVALRLDAVAGERPRHLIETLAEEMAAMILSEFSVSRVTVEIKKFILPQTESVGVRITRCAERR